MLADVHLALVHEVEQGAHLAHLDVPQVDDRVGVAVLDEDLLKVRTARGQDRLVGLVSENEREREERTIERCVLSSDGGATLVAGGRNSNSP